MILGLLAIGVFVLWTVRGLGPIAQVVDQEREARGIKQVQLIAAALNSYARDHHGAYPDGSTSTDVFQKLLDGKYVDDPKVFFTLLPAKIPADSKQLEAQNVCFDFTAGASANSPGDLPLVFTTGYDVTYTAGSNARHASDLPGIFHGMAVDYKDGSAHFRRAAADGSVPNVVPKDFDAKGETYRQVRP